MTDHIALIIGAGAKVGHSVAEAFKATGYKVALASRSQDPETSTSTELHIPTDCVNPDDIVKAFEKVRALWGTPQVVVYNGERQYTSSPLTHH
jgi:NAD(P)-dependent dehydrogenase (short-subunit alcohol dehydrogenase family)